MRASSLVLSAIAVSLGIGLTACPARQAGSPRVKYVPLADPIDLDVEGDYSHESTHCIFPASLGGIPRNRVTKYDQAALDVAAGYDEPGNMRTLPPTTPISLTVFVYPAQEKLEAHMEGVEAEIPLAFPGATLAASEPYTFVSGERSVEGLYSRHRIPSFASSEDQAVVSDTYLFRVKREGASWFLKVRATFPKPAAERVDAAIEAWLRPILSP